MSRVTVEQGGDDIIVSMPYDEDAKQALKEEFNARWDPDDKVWIIDANDFDIEDVRKELKLHFGRVS